MHTNICVYISYYYIQYLQMCVHILLLHIIYISILSYVYHTTIKGIQSAYILHTQHICVCISYCIHTCMSLHVYTFKNHRDTVCIHSINTLNIFEANIFIETTNRRLTQLRGPFWKRAIVM